MRLKLAQSALALALAATVTMPQPAQAAPSRRCRGLTDAPAQITHVQRGAVWSLVTVTLMDASAIGYRRTLTHFNPKDYVTVTGIACGTGLQINRLAR